MRRSLAAAVAVTLSTIMAPQLRAQVKRDSLVKPQTTHDTIYRHALHAALPQWPTRVDTAAIQRIALNYLRPDSTYARTVDRRPLQIRGDTAIAMFWYGAEVTMVLLERRQRT